MDNDCWVGYDGKVYDVTSFLPMHKGGPAKIAPTCGTATEFAAAFEAKHGKSKVGILESQPLMGTLGQ
jgi:cytochrome b involved in lipid metabolism